MEDFFDSVSNVYISLPITVSKVSGKIFGNLRCHLFPKVLSAWFYCSVQTARFEKNGNISGKTMPLRTVWRPDNHYLLEIRLFDKNVSLESSEHTWVMSNCCVRITEESKITN